MRVVNSGVRARRALYFQHASELGGSIISLLTLIEHLDPSRYLASVCCLSNSTTVVSFYESHGISPLVAEGEMFRHTTGGWWSLASPRGIASLVYWLAQLPGAVSRMSRVIRMIKPDIVHLNSLTLAPYAPFLRRLGVPVVLHVRETVQPGHLGLRRSGLSYLVRKGANEVIFISYADQTALVGSGCGHVVYNSVDFHTFDHRIDRGASRMRLGLPETSKVILYLGGVSEIKGIRPLLAALEAVRARIPELVCLMPGADFNLHWRYPLLSRLLHPQTRDERLARQHFAQSDAASYIRPLPFRHDVPTLLAAADVVVFPSIRPHFPRPVMEAAAMGRPVVASALDGPREIIQPEVTGLLVAPGDVSGLSAALQDVLLDRAKARRMGEQAHRRARELFDAHANTQCVMAIYDQVLARS
jgi:glycosyltransferase involved in cell wall biosynthesis